MEKQAKKSRIPSPYDAHREGQAVRYWSVYIQGWRVAWSRADVSDRDYAALGAFDRDMLATLPVTPRY